VVQIERRADSATTEATGCPEATRGGSTKQGVNFWSEPVSLLTWSKTRQNMPTQNAPTAAGGLHAAYPTGHGTSVSGLFYLGTDPAPGAPLDHMAVEGAGRLLAQRALQIWRTDLQMWRSAPQR
jgi:hypothetical protein